MATMDTKQTRKLMNTGKKIFGTKKTKIGEALYNKQTSPSPEAFIDYLQKALIPDLRDSGQDEIADNFETAIKFIQKNNSIQEYTASNVNFPEEIATNINKQYGNGLKRKYSEDDLVKLIRAEYIKLKIGVGIDSVQAKRSANNAIAYDEDFLSDTISAIK